MTTASDPYKDISLLEECDIDEKRQFLRLCKPVVLKKDENVYTEGERGDTIYIVWKGFIGSYSKGEDGSHRDIARFSRGKFFGETALFEGMTRTSFCYAITDAQLLALPAKDFYDFIETHPGTGMRICKAMARHVTAWLFEATNFLTTMVMWGEKARRRAITDDLTGLFNQRFFTESVEGQVMKYKSKGGIFSLILIDLDNIHKMNEYYGFRIADEYLKRVGRIISSSFGSGAIVSRLGGDEFAVLMPETSIPEALSGANRFREGLATHSSKWKIAATPFGERFTASIGIAEYPAHGSSPDEIKNAADEALRSAKRQGKDKAVCAGESGQ